MAGTLFLLLFFPSYVLAVVGQHGMGFRVHKPKVGLPGAHVQESQNQEMSTQRGTYRAKKVEMGSHREEMGNQQAHLLKKDTDSQKDYPHEVGAHQNHLLTQEVGLYQSHHQEIGAYQAHLHNPDQEASRRRALRTSIGVQEHTLVIDDGSRESTLDESIIDNHKFQDKQTKVIMISSLDDDVHLHGSRSKFNNAYGTILYMGTPRDYEFYIAARVLLQSLAHLHHVQADLLLIASMDVPDDWVQTFLKEGVKVVRVPNIFNPFSNRPYFNQRFKFTLNKLYAWKLVDYERIVMLDVDNVFLRNTDELFRCGQFCAVFIDPCIFHTGLFVLQPSDKIFKSMYTFLMTGVENIDGADQGFLTSYFTDLLDQPLFHTPMDNRTRLDGFYRLPLGYQMDASYFYIRMKWRIPCGANSVITFPSASWLKPWYWWSWPVLPLGLSWHDQRKATIGYAAEFQALTGQCVIYFAILTLGVAAWKRLLPGMLMVMMDGDKCYTWLLVRACVPRKLFWPCLVMWVRIVPPLCVVASFVLPMWMVPTTSHPIAGWIVSLFGAFSLLMASMAVYKLPLGPVLVSWSLVGGSLFVMAAPFYKNGVLRMLVIFGFAALSTPILWWSITSVAYYKILPSTHHYDLFLVDRENGKSGVPLIMMANNRVQTSNHASRNCSD